MPMLSVGQRRSLERALLTYSAQVKRAMPYLEGRGIDLAAASSAGLGVVVDPIPGHEHLRGRLAIPYLTRRGPVNFNFRCMEDHRCKDYGHQKYMMWAGLSTNLYHVKSIDAAPEWITVAEGELDALSANIAGIPCVGIGGATKWESWWNLIFQDFVRVYVWQEGDDAGKKFGDRLVQETEAIRIVLPEGEDVNSLWVKNGSEALREMIKR